VKAIHLKFKIMKITISTTSIGGHITCYLIDADDHIIVLSVHDSDTRECELIPGKKYRFEWHVWGITGSEYGITATVDPACIAFPDFNWDKKYDGSHQDMGGFYFSC
jgi:hypothetical protein